MADEPSIDEILASLDRLLREGEGRNDEPEAAPPAAGEPEFPSRHDAPTPHFFEVLDDEVEAGHADADEAEPVQEPRTDAPAGEEPGAQASRLFVLTDAMMVDDQPSLPLGMGGEAGGDAVDETGEADEAMRQALAIPDAGEPEEPAPEVAAMMPESEAASEAQPDDAAAQEYGAEGLDVGLEPQVAPDPAPAEIGMAPEIEMEPEAAFVPAFDEAPADMAAQAPEPAWDEADVQALVDQITDDVCSTMAEQLPEMIRMALAVRLGAFIDAHKNNQDTGSQE